MCKCSQSCANKMCYMHASSPFCRCQADCLHRSTAFDHKGQAQHTVVEFVDHYRYNLYMPLPCLCSYK